MKTLAGKVCIVTGASRGLGRGIALQLGEAGATVYITGRTMTAPSGSEKFGSLTDTAREIESRGGKCIPVQCDHSKDEDIHKLFEKVEKEQNGQLDVLVNNAYAGVNAIYESLDRPFWEQDPLVWDAVNNVGLRNHYICSVLASRMMVPRKQGLIVNISSAGGLSYFFNVPYCIGKAACDRMAQDCSIELKKHNVAFVSLWPGAVQTETVKDLQEKVKDPAYDKYMVMFENCETAEYSGKCVVNLASDPKIMKKTGKCLISGDLGTEYGFVDVDGNTPYNIREVKTLVKMVGPAWLAPYIPSFIKVPYWILTLSASKF